MVKNRENNDFRFQTFAERIAAVNIDVIHKIKYHDDQVDEHSTYFGEALSNWSDLNCTEYFSKYDSDFQVYEEHMMSEWLVIELRKLSFGDNFHDEVSDKAHSFAQLVHNETVLVETLKKHLIIPKTQAYEPLLDLLVQLARDLQADFYKHFQDVFQVLVRLLNENSHEADVLEKLFSCLAYLFKFLWRYLVKDVKDVYGTFSSLISSEYKGYIRDFAAQSFAFLMRKVKNHSDFFDFLFSSLEDNPDSAAGVGQMLFEMMKGVKKQFHSSALQIFPVILSKLGPDSKCESRTKLPWELVETAVCQMMKSCAEHGSKESIGQFWTVLLNAFTDLQAPDSKSKSTDLSVMSAHMCRLLRVLSVWLDHHEGVLIPDPSQVAEVFVQVLSTCVQPEVTGAPLLPAVSSLMVSHSDRLTMGVTSRIFSQVFATNFLLTDLSVFIQSLYDLFLFEKDVIPNLVSYVQNHISSAETTEKDALLALVTHVVLHKVIIPADGSQLSSLSTIDLNFTHPKRGFVKDGFPEYLLSVLDEAEKTELGDARTLSTMWAALVCLPHCRSVKTDSTVKKLTLVWSNLLRNVSVTEEDETRDNFLFVMEQLLISMMLMNDDKSLQNLIAWTDLKQMLIAHPRHGNVLKMVDFYLSQWSLELSDVLTEECLLELLPLLQTNLATWSSQVRLLSLHIMSLFPVRLPVIEDNEPDQMSIFDICLSAERSPVDVYNYRDRLRYLQKLDHGLVSPHVPVGPFRKVPLYYLSGTLYINFKLFWKPLRELIKTYAEGMEEDVFWSVMLEQLTEAARRVETEADVYEHKEKVLSVRDESSLSGLFESKYQIQEETEMPDHLNFRLQLWEAMELFPEKCESRVNEIVQVFFKFLSDEYHKRDMNCAPAEDISLKTSMGDMSEVADDEEHDEEEEEERKVEPEKQSKKKQIKKKTKQKGLIPSLLAHLHVFSKFKKPKSISQDQELRNVYQQLLHHKDSSVQKAAFNCVMTYSHKYLNPYRENFERLLDDKTFKSEIVAFSVDPDNTQIKDGHRLRLLPVLMGILYGRMQSRIGKETSGKAKSNIRRAVVFRFLTGCSSLELKVFLDLVFEPLLHFVTDDPVEMVKRVSESVNIENIFPVRRMRGILQTAQVVIDKLRHQMDDFFQSLLHILLGLGATCNACLAQRDQLRPSAVSALKQVRQMVMLAVVQFFEEFDKYEMTEKEVQAVFQVMVWPQLDKLEHEGIYSPTPLLKLFRVWTGHVRYFYHLERVSPHDSELSPLSGVFTLLSAKGCASSVSSAILDIVDNLLSLEESQEGEIMLNSLSDIDVQNYETCKEYYKTCGMKLLKPFIPSILMFLKRSVESVGVGELSKKKTFVTELQMLAKVSALVTSDEQCSILCSMLFPFLDNKCKRTMDLEENILHSIVNLTRVIQAPKQFYIPVSKLFSVLENRQSRSYLCTILKIIGQKCEEHRTAADIVDKLNAWNPRRAEEPDYTTRLEAFKQFNENVRNMDPVEAEAVLPIIHNCCHFILKIEDLSMKDNSTFCLITLINQLARLKFDQDIFREVVTQGILPMVKNGLYNKSQNVRNEFLALLGALVRAFPEHPTFEGLHGLTCTDVDNDFFENIKHIQVHQRVKAMRQLVKYLTDSPLRSELLTSYFLPLASTVTLDPNALKIQGLREAAVELITVLCKVLPWQHYRQQLKFYLGLLPRKLENHKFLVRIIVAILNMFHYDISKTELTPGKDPQQVAGIKAEREQEETKDDDAVDLDTSVLEDPSEPTQATQITSEGKQLCSPALATRIHVYVLKNLLPDLHKLLTQKISSDVEHKSVKSKMAEDHEILRVPIALAMVKLLQTLPHGALRYKLPGILMKVCNFLKSRSREIRDTSRDTLIQISQSLGVSYLNFIVKELRDVLTRGYQLHVLGYTVHRLLSSLQGQLKPGDLDKALYNLSEVFQQELFGNVAEEKNVEGITSKLMEARVTRSYDSYEIVAKHVGVSSVNQLIVPLKKRLETTYNQKVSHKIEEVLRRVTSGLIDNSAISRENLMVLIHSLILENIDDVEEKTEVKSAKPVSRRPVSCLLLPESIPRGGSKPKAHRKTNMHILVSFGLQLLQLCLKQSRLVASKQQHLQLLDPLVEPISRCLHSKHIKVNSIALRCVSFILRFPLPSLKKHIKSIAGGMFLLLQNYTSAGAARGENQELVITCFKAMTVLVRDVQFYQVETEQLQVLLSYCEDDLLDNTRQSTGFNLLKAILSRKLKVDELHDLLTKVRELSITSNSDHVRLQCRQVYLQFLLNYPQKKGALTSHIEYYITQLTYELEHGRVSALEMLATVFTNFPMKVLIQFSGLFFIPMAATLVNDESQKCRKLTALAITTLLEKIDAPTRDMLFSIVKNWMKDKKVMHRTLGAQVCGLFVEVEKKAFERRLKDILPLLHQLVNPDQYHEGEDSRQFELDHSLFSVLTAISKIITHCNILRNKTYTVMMSQMWEHVNQHLIYPHSWCRLTACQLFGQLFSAWPPDEVKSELDSGNTDEFLLTDTRQKLRGMSDSFISQLQSEHLTEELVNQIVKNVLYLVKVTKVLPVPDYETDVCQKEQGVSVKWLIKQMVKEANNEAITNPKVTVKRAGVFKWLAAVCLEEEKALVVDTLRIIVSTLHRELTSIASEESDLSKLAQEVLNLLKKKVGVEAYTEVFTEVQQKRSGKRLAKKRKRAVEAVSRPDVAARRKMKKYESRKESKKRKIKMMKTGKNAKKRKLQKMAILNS